MKKFFTRKAATSWGNVMQLMKYCCKRMSVAETNLRNDNTTGLIALGVVVAVMAIVIIIMAIVIHRLRTNGQKRTSSASSLSFVSNLEQLDMSKKLKRNCFSLH